MRGGTALWGALCVGLGVSPKALCGRVDGQVYPVRDRIECESFNGTWDLSIDGGPWRKAQVPGTWESQGLKRANVNFIRIAHAPFAPSFYEECSCMGFSVSVAQGEAVGKAAAGLL